MGTEQEKERGAVSFFPTNISDDIVWLITMFSVDGIVIFLRFPKQLFLGGHR